MTAQNALLIVIDALRFDALEDIANRPSVAPNLARLARNGLFGRQRQMGKRRSSRYLQYFPKLTRLTMAEQQWHFESTKELCRADQGCGIREPYLGRMPADRRG